MLSEHAQAFVDLCRDKRGVTFAELEELLRERGVDVEGPMELTMTDEPALVLWRGISPEFVDVVQEAVRAQAVAMSPTVPLTYVVDGKVCDLPVARQRRHYTTDHWLPVAFSATA